MINKRINETNMFISRSHVKLRPRLIRFDLSSDIADAAAAIVTDTFTAQSDDEVKSSDVIEMQKCIHPSHGRNKNIFHLFVTTLPTWVLFK